MGATEIFEDELEDDDEEEEGADEDEQEEALSAHNEEDESGYAKAYNPNQDPDERRRLRANIRDHQRMVEGGFLPLVIVTGTTNNVRRESRPDDPTQQPPSRCLEEARQSLRQSAADG
jgi:hypothetical protein